MIRAWAAILADRWRVLTLRKAPTGTKALGAAGERAAAKFLKRAGYKIMARNVVVPFGEADLVCRAPDRETIVIVEVKSRRVAGGPDDSGTPGPRILAEDAVDAEKRRRLSAITRHLARVNRWHGKPLRVDVVAVEFRDQGRLVIRHHVGVIGVR